MTTPGLEDKTTLGYDGTTIGQIRKTPIVLYGMFVELARQLYSPGTDWIVDNKVNWRPVEEESQIWIDTEYRWEDKSPEFRPAIYISLSQIQYSSYTGDTKGLTHMNLEEGEYHYSRAGKGAVTWVHIGRTKGEAVKLVGMTLDFIDAFADVIRKEFCFKRFWVTNISPLVIVEESHERLRGEVTAQFEFEETWVLKAETAKLKRLVFNAGRDLMSVIGSTL